MRGAGLACAWRGANLIQACSPEQPRAQAPQPWAHASAAAEQLTSRALSASATSSLPGVARCKPCLQPDLRFGLQPGSFPCVFWPWVCLRAKEGGALTCGVCVAVCVVFAKPPILTLACIYWYLFFQPQRIYIYLRTPWAQVTHPPRPLHLSFTPSVHTRAE